MGKKSLVTVVELEYPVEVDGETYEKLVLRRPRFKDMQHVTDEQTGEIKSTLAGIRAMIAALADVPQDVVDELDNADIEKVGLVLSGKKPKAKKASG